MITKNSNEKKNEEEKEQSELSSLQKQMTDLLSERDDMRSIGLMGDVTEEKSAELLMALLLLTELSGQEPP